MRIHQRERHKREIWRCGFFLKKYRSIYKMTHHIVKVICWSSIFNVLPMCWCAHRCLWVVNDKYGACRSSRGEFVAQPRTRIKKKEYADNYLRAQAKRQWLGGVQVQLSLKRANKKYFPLFYNLASILSDPCGLQHISRQSLSSNSICESRVLWPCG